MKKDERDLIRKAIGNAARVVHDALFSIEARFLIRGEDPHLHPSWAIIERILKHEGAVRLVEEMVKEDEAIERERMKSISVVGTKYSPEFDARVNGTVHKR